MILLDNDIIETRQNNPQEVNYSFAKRADINALIDFMERHPQAAFCEWQDSQFINTLLKIRAAIIVIGKLDNTIIGVSIAGIMGTRATINHLAVDALHRNQKIASHLVSLSIAEIKQRGVQRVFLFVDDDNTPAISFWSKHGFNPTINEITMERDL